MGWTARAPGWRVAGYEQSIRAIDRFESAYRSFLENPDIARRAEAEACMIGAAFACDAVGAVPGHPRLDKWGVATLAFLHTEPGSKVTASETSGPVRAALHKARHEYQRRIEDERRKRRNPLRWVAFGIGEVFRAPVRLVRGHSQAKGNDDIPVALVVIAGLVAFVAVAGVTFTLIA